MFTVTEIIERTIVYVKHELAAAEGGHDWWHIERVWKTAQHIAQQEQVNLLVVELGALLHDIADSKFHNGDEEIGPQKAQTFLQSIGVSAGIIDAVVYIIRNISFKGQKQQTAGATPELQVVQDADRLDAIGAIGIARAFSYGGFKNREFFNPAIPPDLHQTQEAYKNSTTPTINHFYEKLLLLKDLMNTTTGKELAQERHLFMEGYLEQFYKEWEGQG